MREEFIIEIRNVTPKNCFFFSLRNLLLSLFLRILFFKKNIFQNKRKTKSYYPLFQIQSLLY